MITLEWTIYAICPVDYFILHYEVILLDGCKNNDGIRTGPIWINGTSLSVNVTELEPFTSYAFQLAPYSFVGAGFERKLNVTTNEEGT